MGSQALFFYDGLCGFCNATVQWMLRHDRFDQFRFAPQQSDIAQEMLQRHGVDATQMLNDNSVYLLIAPNSAQERLFFRSDVTVQALLLMGGAWSVMGNCLKLVPRAIRDFGYTLIARNRFRLAGRYDTCPLPSAADRAKFLETTDLWK